MDYIETRVDLDTSKIAYLGYSWGSFHAPFILGIEKRINLGIISVFGASGSSHFPERYSLNYLSKVKIPVLLLSGKYDYTWSFKEQQLYYDWLGTALKDKKWVVYETIHDIPLIEKQKETLFWLDQYFGTGVNR